SNNDAEIITNYRQLEDDPSQPLDNRTIGGDLYHPGSVYKLVSAAAAIESGAATPETKYPNPAELTLPQSSAVMQNSTRGTCGSDAEATLQQAIVYSCNIPIAEMAMSMDRDAIPKMASAFGCDRELSIPVDVTPSVAASPSDQAQVAFSSIDQLDVRTTPLQMAMVSSGIANGGTL